MSVDRLAVAEVLERIGDHLEFKAENPFRVRAFRTAAKAVVSLPVPVETALADGSLASVRGIGPATLAIVREFVETGRCRYLDELRREVPPSVLELLSVPGLGVTRVRALHQQLGIDSLAKLELAARDGTLATIRGLGPKTAERVLKGIAAARGKGDRRLIPQAVLEAELVQATLAAVPGVIRAGIAGEVRRRMETVGELTFVLEAGPASPAEILGAVRRMPGQTGWAQGAESEATFRLAGAMPIRVRVAPPESFGAMMVLATGSEAHVRELAAHAETLGFSLAGSGLRRGAEVVPVPEEADLYRSLGLPEVPPEIREGMGEVEQARRGALPRLLERTDLRGMLHCHSTWSDGATGIEELAAACRDAGYEYLGLSDHSQAAAYAGGLRPDELVQQWEEIDRLNAGTPGIRVLKGIEADILGDGRLDYDDGILAGFDFVIGSVHSRLGQDPAEMTERLLRALDHPALTILGHPTGRLLLSREPARIDYDRLFDRAAERGVALEINGDPHRLDLDWRLVRRAREKGVMISIGSDAHSIADFRNQDFAVWMARKAGLTAADVLNRGSAEDFLAFARARP